MPFAVTLELDAATALQVERMWDTLHAQGVHSGHHEQEYGPHITLAVYPDNTSANRLQTALERVTESWATLPVMLSGLGLFPGATSAVSLAPVVTPELLAMHAAVVDGLGELETHSHYQRGMRMPHVTLLDRCHSPERAIAALMPSWSPLAGSLNQVDAVHFSPIATLWSRQLLTK